MFPEAGVDVPFTISNDSYRDGFGRDTVTWIRNFVFAKPRRFNAYMVYSEERGKIVDYLGSHQHLAVDIDLRVDDEGRLYLQSSKQRFYEGPLAFVFPNLMTGTADVREWFDDIEQRFLIDVRVHNRFFGPLFGYRGSFTVECLQDAPLPSTYRPVREERRK